MIQKYKRGNETVEAIKLTLDNLEEIKGFVEVKHIFQAEDKLDVHILWNGKMLCCLNGQIIVKDETGGISIWSEKNFNNVFYEKVA